MGGFGSGGHNRRRDYLEQFRKLDAAYLQKQGILTDGWRGHISWTTRSGDKPSISIDGERDSVLIHYRARSDDADEWTPIRERFDIEWSPRHLGGAQAYFLCCRCNRRSRFLYLANLRFRCRTCHRLIHASSQEQPGNRATRKNQKLRGKLGASLALGDFVARPKGMHQRTYQRYLDRIHEAECEVNDDMIRVLARIQKTDIRLGRKVKDFWI